MPGLSAWFDAANADRPGATNPAFGVRAMLKTARLWGEFGEDVPDACANITPNRRRPVRACPHGNALANLEATGLE